MKNLKYKIFLILGAMVLWMYTGCYYDEYLPEEEPPIVIEDQVNFTSDIIPIFNQSCNTSGCHNQGGIAPDLSVNNAYNALQLGSYLDVTTPAESELYQWMRGNRAIDMPPAGPDQEDNAKILAWITQGALNN